MDEGDEDREAGIGDEENGDEDLDLGDCPADAGELIQRVFIYLFRLMSLRGAFKGGNVNIYLGFLDIKLKKSCLILFIFYHPKL